MPSGKVISPLRLQGWRSTLLFSVTTEPTGNTWPPSRQLAKSSASRLIGLRTAPLLALDRESSWLSSSTKGPDLAVTGLIMGRIAVLTSSAIEERFYCALSWVFLRRANSEATALIRAQDASVLCDLFRPIQCHDVIGLVGDKLVIRLSPEKTHLAARVYAGAALALRLVESQPTSTRQSARFAFHGHGSPRGYRLAGDCSEITSRRRRSLGYKQRLRRATWPMLIKIPSILYGEGGAQELIKKGGDLATLLMAGGWRSSAFQVVS